MSVMVRERPRRNGGRETGAPGLPRRAHRRAPLRRRPKAIGSFVARFKAASTKRINALRDLPGTPVRQRDSEDRVIRNDDAYVRMLNHILTNPVRRELDRENPDRWRTDDFDRWLDLDPISPDGRSVPLWGRTAVRPFAGTRPRPDGTSPRP